MDINRKTVSVLFMLFSTLFCVCLITANVLETKQISFGPVNITGGLLVFPVSYIINDCECEVWGYAKDERLTRKQLLNEEYQGIRPAIGYPSLPDLSISFLLDELIDMKRIGIRLTENGMMQPHASVCGFMFAHPQAHYFSVGKIDELQLADYAARRGKDVAYLRNYLITNLQY